MLTEAADYDTLTRNFRWDVPARFNMATACCDRHADSGNRTALIYVDEDGTAQRTSFDETARDVLPLRQCADGGWSLCAATASRCSCRSRWNCRSRNLAAFRAGLVSVPLFTLFGEDALEFRLANSGAKAVVTDETGWEKLCENPRPPAVSGRTST